MATTSLMNRFQRVSAAARRQQIEELETLRSAAKAKAKKNKCESTDKDDGKGPKPKATANEKFKAQSPKIKGNKADAKLDVKGPVGETKKSPKKSKQQELDSASAKLKSLTSGIPKLNAKSKSEKKELGSASAKLKSLTSGIPKSKSKVAETDTRRAWRKAKLAELKVALDQGSPRVLDEKGEEAQVMPNTEGKASKEQRVPAFQVLQKSQKLLPGFTQALTQANDMLENAVMGADLVKIKGALSFLLTKINEITKSQVMPLATTIRDLMAKLSPTKMASGKFASITSSAHNFKQLDSEFARSRVLIRMASNTF